MKLNTTIQSPRKRDSLVHALVLVLWGALLATPAGARAQDGEETSVWQFGVREVDWDAVEGLQRNVREYQVAGAIGAYELRIWTEGARYAAMVTAEIMDAKRLAELRGLDAAAGAPKDVVTRTGPSS